MAVTRRRVVGRPRSLLLEIGTEELPPNSLRGLAESFATTVYESLLDAGVVEENTQAYRCYATPRRLAVWIGKVRPCQPDRIVERRGPSIKAAFDAKGNPTPAALGFARSCGVAIDSLGQQISDKGAWLLYQQKVAGQRIRDLVEQALDKATRELPIAKRMRWGDHQQEFVRPAHWLLAMYGSELLKVSVLGLQAGDWTRGHRFQTRGNIRILSADRYVETLKKEGGVIVDYLERQSLIKRQVNRLARRNKGQAVISPALLAEVTGLVEWPQALYGEFDRRFLKVPPEVLVATMRDHQKYFHLEDDKGRMMPSFIAVTNLHSRVSKRVRCGNERVLRARFADAEFFWGNDLLQHPEQRLKALDRVLYHEKLGSIGAKVSRISPLAVEIGQQIGADIQQVERACKLCKTDLVAGLVGEFPELQGIAGSYYANHYGEDRAVCMAIRAHYLPRFSGDQLPQGHVSRCLALADRIDTIVGMFSCGESPTGDKDPYALRRAALGILRILIEKRHDIDLYQLFRKAAAQFAVDNAALDTSETMVQQAFDFLTDRLRVHCQSLGYDILTINAVAAVSPHSPLDFHWRLVALHEFCNTQSVAARSLASANKRIVNILSKQNICADSVPESALFQEKAESALAKKLDKLGTQASKQFAKRRYGRGLMTLSNLKKPIDRFFDQVMVMDDDPCIRKNRLALLARTRQLFLAAADISLLRVE